ncbi:MAG TPA: hypothetical protein PL037_09320, partial [Elusimicrobiales bacterium]|nr:hypothetical protein [Elusimicrobiales bacterium]
MFLAGPGAVFLAGEAAKNKARNTIIAEPDRYRAAFLIGRRGVDPGPARIVQSDPRVLLRTVSAGYDLIIQTTPEPLNAASNRFFTVQFFREAAGALKKNGILAFSLPFSENYLPPERAYLAASVLASASSVFRHVEPVPGGALTVLASDGPIDLSPETLARRYKARGLDSPYVAPQNLPFILDPYRRQWALAATGRIKAPPLN